MMAGRRSGQQHARRRPRERPAALLALPLAVAALVGTLQAPPGARVAAAERAVVRKQVWFAPGPGTPDLLDLFRDEDAWPVARQRMAVFQFYQGHLLSPPPQDFEGNTYSALRDVRAFAKLTLFWRKPTAIEVGAVKGHYCSADGSREATAVADTLTAIGNVGAGGGIVSYLSMDEPFLSAAVWPQCGAPDAEAAADRIAAYISGVKARYPGMIIGLIEPYPFFPPARIARFLAVLEQRGFKMPFFHLDVDLPALRPGRDDFARDVRYLAGVCAASGTRFGIIFNGEASTSNADYMKGAWKRVQATADAFADWPDMPQDLVFQSWAVQKGTTRFLLPTNLPETSTDTHPEFLNRATPVLHGPQHATAPRR